MSKFYFDDEQNSQSLSIASILGEYWADAEAADAAQTARSGGSAHDAPERESDEDGVRIYRPRREPQPETRSRYASLWANDWASRPVPREAVSSDWEQPVVPPPPPAPGMSVREILSDYWENQAPQAYGIDLDEPPEAKRAPAEEAPLAQPEPPEERLPEPEVPEEPVIQAEPEAEPETEEAYSVSRILEEYWESLGGRDKTAVPAAAAEVPDGNEATATPDEEEQDPPAAPSDEEAESATPEESDAVQETPEETGGEAAEESAPEESGEDPDTADEAEEDGRKAGEEAEAEPEFSPEPLPEYTEEEAREYLLSAMQALGIDPDAAPDEDEDEDVRVWGAVPPAHPDGQSPDDEGEEETVRVWNSGAVTAEIKAEPAADEEDREDVRVWGAAPAEPEPDEIPAGEQEEPPAEEPEQAPLPEEKAPASEESEKAETQPGDEQPEADSGEAAAAEDAEEPAEPEAPEAKQPPEVVWDAETEASFAAMLKIWDDLNAANSADEARAEARTAEAETDAESDQEETPAPAQETDAEDDREEETPTPDPEAESAEEYSLPAYSVQEILAEFWAEQRGDAPEFSDTELSAAETSSEPEEPDAQEGEPREEPAAAVTPAGEAEEETAAEDAQAGKPDEEKNQPAQGEDRTARPKGLWSRLRGLFSREKPSEEPEADNTPPEDGFELEESLFPTETLALDPEYFEDQGEDAEKQSGDTAVFGQEATQEFRDADKQGKAVDMLTTEEAAIRGDGDVPGQETREESRVQEAAVDWEPEQNTGEKAEDRNPDALPTGIDQGDEEAPEPETDGEGRAPADLTDTELKDRLSLLYAVMSGESADSAPLFDNGEAERGGAGSDEAANYFGLAVEEERSRRQELEEGRQEPSHFRFEEDYLAAAEANRPAAGEKAEEDEETAVQLPSEESAFAADAESSAPDGRQYSVDDILAQFRADMAGETFSGEMPEDDAYTEEKADEAPDDRVRPRSAAGVKAVGAAAAGTAAVVGAAAAGSAAAGAAGAAAGTLASMTEEARQIAAIIGSADESGLAGEQGHQPFSFGGRDGEEKPDESFDPRFHVGSSRSGMYFGDKELDLSADEDYEPPRQSTDDLYHWSRTEEGEEETGSPEKEDNSLLGRLRRLMRPQPKKRSLNSPPEYSAEEYFAAAAAEEEKKAVEAALQAARLAAGETEEAEPAIKPAPAVQPAPAETREPEAREPEAPEAEASEPDFDSLFASAVEAEETAESLPVFDAEPGPEAAAEPTIAPQPEPEQPEPEQPMNEDAPKSGDAAEGKRKAPGTARRATGVELDDEDAFPSFWQFIQGMAVGLVARIFGAGVRTAPDTVEDEDEDLGPEQTPAAATRYYGSQVQSLRMRFRLGIVLLAVLAYITLGLPVTGMLKTYRVAAAFCLGLQLAIMLLNLDVITNSALNLAQGRFGADSMATLCCVLTSLDALAVALNGFGTPHTPLCLISSLSLMGVLCSSVLSARGLRKALRVPAIGKRSYTVCGEQDLKGKDVTLLKSSRPATGFVRRSEETPPDENAFYRVAPLLGIFCLLLAVIVVLVKKSTGDFLYVLTALLCPAVPVTALLCFALPYFVGTMRIFSSGAAVAGWSGLCDIGRSQNLIVTDRDLFPEGSVEIDSIRIFADVSAEKIISYAGSMICASGTGIASCFADLMQKNACSMKRVENFEFLPGGGFKGIIDGENVLCGGTELMRLMNVRIPYRLVSKTTVLLAVDGILYGIFNLKYEALPPVRKALVGLIRSNRHPIFAIRDFNVSPEMLHESFDVATDGYDFPPYVERFALSEAKPGQNSKVAAVVCREGLGPLVHMADTGRSMYVATRINLLLTILAAVLGVLLVFGKLLSAGTVGAGFLLLFMLAAVLPVAALSLILKF